MSHDFATELPPQGIESNFDNPPSLYQPILATVVLSHAATTVLTAARLVTKKSMSAWLLEDCKFAAPLAIQSCPSNGPLLKTLRY